MYRLPGPSTMRSASAIAASASSDARTSSGVTQTRSIAGGPHDPRLAVDDRARRRARAWSVSGVAVAGTTWPADGEDPVDLPDALLEVAALDRGHRGEQQVADRMAAERPPRSPEAAIRRTHREAVLEQLAHQRLGVGERRDAVADVADRRDAELLAQHAGRAAVVGDRHDRGEVARVLLEAAQERRQAGPAADRHDPRAAGEEPLLVDDARRAAGRPRPRGAGRSATRIDAIGAERDERRRRPRRRSGRAAGTAGTGA